MTRIDDRVRREAVREHADGREQRVPVGAGKVDATDGTGEEQVAAEEVAVGVEADVRRRVARNRDAFERDARDVDRLAAVEERVGRVGAAGHAHRRELRIALEPVALTLRHVDRCAGAFGEIGDTAEMVEMPVGDEDRRAARL